MIGGKRSAPEPEMYDTRGLYRKFGDADDDRAQTDDMWGSMAPEGLPFLQKRSLQEQMAQLRNVKHEFSRLSNERDFDILNPLVPGQRESKADLVRSRLETRPLLETADLDPIEEGENLFKQTLNPTYFSSNQNKDMDDYQEVIPFSPEATQALVNKVLLLNPVSPRGSGKPSQGRQFRKRSLAFRRKRYATNNQWKQEITLNNTVAQPQEADAEDAGSRPQGTAKPPRSSGPGDSDALTDTILAQLVKTQEDKNRMIDYVNRK